MRFQKTDCQLSCHYHIPFSDICPSILEEIFEILSSEIRIFELKTIRFSFLSSILHNRQRDLTTFHTAGIIYELCNRHVGIIFYQNAKIYCLNDWVESGVKIDRNRENCANLTIFNFWWETRNKSFRQLVFSNSKIALFCKYFLVFSNYLDNNIIMSLRSLDFLFEIISYLLTLILNGKWNEGSRGNYHKYLVVIFEILLYRKII